MDNLPKDNHDQETTVNNIENISERATVNDKIEEEVQPTQNQALIEIRPMRDLVMISADSGNTQMPTEDATEPKDSCMKAQQRFQSDKLQSTSEEIDHDSSVHSAEAGVTQSIEGKEIIAIGKEIYSVKESEKQNFETGCADNDARSEGKQKKTLRQILRNLEAEKAKGEIYGNTTTHTKSDRFPEFARPTAATLSQTGPTLLEVTTRNGQEKVTMTMFETQVHTPIVSPRIEPCTQTGSAAPSQHSAWPKDRGFIGDHTRPPIRPPSTAGEILPRELEIVFSASLMDDRTKLEEMEKKRDLQKGEGIDTLAAIRALRRPRAPTASGETEARHKMVNGGQGKRCGVVPASSFALYPAVEHEVTELTEPLLPKCSSEPTANTVKVGPATTEWKAVQKAGAKKGARETDRGSRTLECTAVYPAVEHEFTELTEPLLPANSSELTANTVRVGLATAEWKAVQKAGATNGSWVTDRDNPTLGSTNPPEEQHNTENKVVTRELSPELPESCLTGQCKAESGHREKERVGTVDERKPAGRIETTAVKGTASLRFGVVRENRIRTDMEVIGLNNKVTDRISHWFNKGYVEFPWQRNQSWKGMRGLVSQHIPTHGKGQKRRQRNRNRKKTSLPAKETTLQAMSNDLGTRYRHEEAPSTDSHSHNPVEGGSRLDRLKRKSAVLLVTENTVTESESRALCVNTEALAAPERVSVVGTYRSHPVAFEFSVTDWDNEWNDGTLSIKRRLKEVIRHRSGVKSSTRLSGLGPVLLRWTVEGRQLRRDEEPDSFASLKRLCERGGEFEATIGVLGGADHAHEDAGNGEVDWDGLDRAVRAVMSGSIAEQNNEISRAQRLLAPIKPEAWKALAELNSTRGIVSAARILTLKDIASTHEAALRSVSLPAWATSDSLVAIRICNISPTAVGWTGHGTMWQAKCRVMEAILGIGNVRSAPRFEWEMFKSHVRVDGDLSSSGCPWSATALLPQGPWIQGLLTGQIPMNGAYAVLAPHSTYVEFELEAKVGELLKSIRTLLGLDEGLFRGLVRNALQRALGAEVCGIRLTTSAFTPAADGKRAKTTFFPSDHEASRIVVGVEATHLLQMGRLGPYITIELGYPPALPVTLETMCPEAPGYALRAMRKVASGTAVRLRLVGALPTTRDVVLGYQGAGHDPRQTGAHLPGGWLSDSIINSIANRALALQLLRQTFRDRVAAVSMVPVGRLKKGGGDPAYLFLMFATIEAAAAFCDAVDRLTLPQELVAAIHEFIDLEQGTLLTFCSYIPPEAIQGCAEKEIVALFKAGMTDEACIRAAQNAPA